MRFLDVFSSLFLGGGPAPLLLLYFEVKIMELGVNAMGNTPVQRYTSASAAAAQQKEANAKEILRKSKQEEIAARKAQQTQQIKPEVYLKDILTITSIFNRKLRFFIDRDSNEVIVKVIDGETDKVIKEIPPEALQRLHNRMREAIGLLIDEEI